MAHFLQGTSALALLLVGSGPAFGQRIGATHEELRGVLLDARGRPLAGVELAVVDGACVDRRDDLSCRGRWSDTTARTDADGRFRITGSFTWPALVVHAGEPEWPSWMLERRLARSDEGAVVLVASFAEIEALAFDRHGGSVADAEIHVVELGQQVRLPDRGAERWILDPERLTARMGPALVAGAQLLGRARPGAELAVVAFSPTRGFAEARVTAPKAGERFLVELSLPDPAPGGTLVARQGEGERDVLVCAPGSGLAVARHPLGGWGRRGDLRIPLPPGPLLLRSVPVERLRCGNAPSRVRELAPLELRLDGGAFGERLLDEPQPRGTALVLRLRANAADMAPELRAAAVAGDEAGQRVHELRNRHDLWARVWLESPDARLPQRLHFLRAVRRGSGFEAGGTRAGALPGLEFVCQERIPAGRRRLRVQCDGFEPLEREVGFEEGGEALLELDLVRSRP